MSVSLQLRAATDGLVVVIGAGQSGLAAARVLHELNAPVVVLEAGDRPAGSWPHYYDSLRLFSPGGIVAASGPFSNPHRPVFPGQGSFTGEASHVAEYRNPEPHAGMRLVVVGAGDSAAPVASELARVADVTIAARHPLRFIPQRIGDHDVHSWLRETEFDSLPPPG
jgi:cation diffusion facilitator CzcD-associated flavoprotein CzcO